METLQDKRTREYCEAKLFEVGKKINAEIEAGTVGHGKKRYGQFTLTPTEWGVVFSDYPDVLDFGKAKKDGE